MSDSSKTYLIPGDREKGLPSQEDWDVFYVMTNCLKQLEEFLEDSSDHVPSDFIEKVTYEKGKPFSVELKFPEAEEYGVTLKLVDLGDFGGKKFYAYYNGEEHELEDESVPAVVDYYRVIVDALVFWRDYRKF